MEVWITIGCVLNVELSIMESKHCKVAIVGHSFPKRLHNYIVNTASEDESKDANMNLAQLSVSWIYKGGWTWKSFSQKSSSELVTQHAESFNIVFFELGSNDLDSTTSAQSIAQLALDTAHDIINNGSSLVILGEVLERSRTHNIPVHMYNQKVHEYNDYLRSYLIDTRYPRKSFQRFAQGDVWFWDHLKLRRSEMPLLQPDGIHLTDYPGNHRLYWSIRLALKRGFDYIY